jgi:5-formyltetrahydrofolate cyclo-ligase
MTKYELREMIKKRLAAMTPFEYQEYNAAISERFLGLDQVRKAASIMMYHSIGSEVETISLIQTLLSAGKTISLPVCTPSRSLIAGLVTDLNELVTTCFGLREPEPRGLRSPEFIDLIVVPGLAFDERGYRLGRGAGYYDRFLEGRPDSYKLGLAYDFQVFPQIPAEAHDIRMDGLITPGGYRELIFNNRN